MEPKPISFFKDFIVEKIRCGSYSSYVKTTDGGHHLFGMNKHFECLLFDDDVKIVTEPHKVNDIVKEKCGITEILEIFPGDYNTKIICKI